VIWLDGLDIPLVAFFDAGFAERYPQEVQPVSRPEGDALARYGANMLPLENTAGASTTPVFTYPYARSREALEQLRRHGNPHPSHGLKMQYANPATGGYPMPTIGAFIQLLPAGFDGASYRATDGTVYCIVEGTGRSVVGDRSFEWAPHDVFVVPSWCEVSHRAHRDAGYCSAFPTAPCKRRWIVARGSARGTDRSVERISRGGADDEKHDTRSWMATMGLGCGRCIAVCVGPCGPSHGKDRRHCRILGTLRRLWRADPRWHEDLSAAERGRLRRQEDRDRGEGHHRRGAGHRQAAGAGNGDPR
jgi:mannose-6-phosphate isomerase-like protein (cupin superfamily)